MCFHSKQSQTAQALEHRFKAKVADGISIEPTIYNGFSFPKTPIITRQAPDKIILSNWGLMPSWAKDTSFRKNTLNARVETLQEKPSFKNYVQNRCLIIADGFFEWKWLDEKGLKKEKYFIELPEQQSFAFAGIWSHWLDQSTGEIQHTYAMLTMQANALMSEIHNTKKRMPIIVSPNTEQQWLERGELYIANDLLQAHLV